MAKFCGKCGTKLNETTGRCPKCEKEQNTRRKKKRIVGIVVPALLLLVIIVTLSHFKVFDSFFRKEVIEYENKDKTYTPGQEFISYDEDSNTIYFSNLLIVYTFSELNEEEKEALAGMVDGKIAGNISGIMNALQIKVKESSLEELNEMAERLMESEEVMFAGYDYPIQLADMSYDANPWSADGQRPEPNRGNEGNPDGTDWWAEATGAYTAWNYSDECVPIKVGILDSGFSVEHEDLTGKIKFLKNYSENTEDNHGTHVAGIIGANNNSIGLRGIADTAELICVDWSPDDKTNYLSAGAYIEIIKQMVESGVKVINNSWGNHFLSKEGYTKLLYSEKNDFTYLLQYLAVHCTGAYDAYVKYVEEYSKRTALDCIAMMVQLLMNKQEDFIIIQAAGNGLDNNGPGVDTKYSSYFCAINENLYNMLSESVRNKLKQNGITYKSIDNRIMIVGAVKNTRINDKFYQMTYFSDYGLNVDICAPGEEIFSTLANNSYGVRSGTSMAAPMVAASTAYVWSLLPEFSAPQIREIILHNVKYQAKGVGNGVEYTYPMLNVGCAVRRAIGIKEKLPESVVTTSKERDIVLVLDISGSMYGTPLEETKRASIDFVETILKEEASIGIVTYDEEANIQCNFSVSQELLTSKIEDICEAGRTNISAGLQSAYDMLQSSDAKKKIIILMSDGLPNEGMLGTDLISFADRIKEEGIYIYTLGFFEEIADYKVEAQYLMEEISNEGCHYEVADAENLVFFFGDIADQLNGQRYIYVRIACPVDVTVSYDGEKLSSKEEYLNTRTNFGTLTFEESSSGNTEDTVKILRLKEGIDYNIQIEGTGRGSMDYTIGFENENGEYSDMRRFSNIKLTRRTVIDTIAARNQETILNIDENGDGRYDLKYKAGENGRGELVDYTYLFYIFAGAVVVFLILVIYTKQKKKVKKA